MAVTLPEEMPQPVDDHHVGHVVPMKILVGVFASLVFLTIVTVSASYVNFGEFNLIVALAIAVVKATLVVLFFMHLIWDRPFNAIVFVGCLIFVSIFIGFAADRHHAVSLLDGQGAGFGDAEGARAIEAGCGS